MHAVYVVHSSVPPQFADDMFDHFIVHTLAFEQNFASSPYAHRYARALQQCRLGIKQGGMGLTSAVLIAPATLHVALREFQTWYQDYAETWSQQTLHNQTRNWLQPISASQPELAGKLLPTFPMFAPCMTQQ